LNKLLNESLKITQELGDVIFIGALAVYAHTKKARDSQDIDFVIQKPISDEYMLSKHYYKSMTGKQPWFTPRGIKIDIYTRDIPGVPFGAIVKYSKKFPVGKKGSIRVIGLEALVVAKHTAQREQDSDDLRNIAKNRLDDIDWKVIQSITNDEYKTSLIKRDMVFFAKL
jgi:predicted nucleotidyltransferase